MKRAVLENGYYKERYENNGYIITEGPGGSRDSNYLVWKGADVVKATATLKEAEVYTDQDGVEGITAFEFFRSQYLQNATPRNVGCINRDIEIGSFHFVRVAAKCFFGGTYLPQLQKAGVTDVEEMREAGFLKYQYYSNWEAKHTGRSDWYGLTVKGLKELYKRYDSWEVPRE